MEHEDELEDYTTPESLGDDFIGITKGVELGRCVYNLCDQNIQSLPEQFFNLISLRVLHLQNNALESISPFISRLSLLEVLDLSGNKLKSLPEEIGTLVNIKGLFLHNNQLVTVPHSVGNLLNLITLSLGCNKLDATPSLSNCTNLRSLSLNHNCLKEIEDLGTGLTLLTTLNLANNKLKEFPKNLPSSLVNLNISSNEISSIPQSVTHLTRVETLNLEGNRFMIAPDLTPFTSLKTVLLNYNPISSSEQQSTISNEELDDKQKHRVSFNNIVKYSEDATETAALQMETVESLESCNQPQIVTEDSIDTNENVNIVYES